MMKNSLLRQGINRAFWARAWVILKLTDNIAERIEWNFLHQGSMKKLLSQPWSKSYWVYRGSFTGSRRFSSISRSRSRQWCCDASSHYIARFNIIYQNGQKKTSIVTIEWNGLSGSSIGYCLICLIPQNLVIVGIGLEIRKS